MRAGAQAKTLCERGRDGNSRLLSFPPARLWMPRDAAAGERQFSSLRGPRQTRSDVRQNKFLPSPKFFEFYCLYTKKTKKNGRRNIRYWPIAQISFSIKS